MTVSIILSLPVMLAAIAAIVIIVLAVPFKTGDLMVLWHLTDLLKVLLGVRDRHVSRRGRLP